MKAVGISVVVEGTSLAVVSMTHTEDDGLSVFLVGAMLTRHGIASWTVLGTVKRYTVDGNSNLPTCWGTFVIAVGFGTVRGVMTSRGVVDR